MRYLILVLISIGNRPIGDHNLDCRSHISVVIFKTDLWDKTKELAIGGQMA